jgi:hypothetical protein
MTRDPEMAGRGLETWSDPPEALDFETGFRGVEVGFGFRKAMVRKHGMESCS